MTPYEMRQAIVGLPQFRLARREIREAYARACDAQRRAEAYARVGFRLADEYLDEAEMLWQEHRRLSADYETAVREYESQGEAP